MNISNYIVKIPTIDSNNFMTSELGFGLIICAVILLVGVVIAFLGECQGMEGIFCKAIGATLMAIGVLAGMFLTYQRGNTMLKETKKNRTQQEQAYEQQDKMDAKLAAELSKRTGFVISTEDAANMRSDDYDFVTTSDDDKVVEIKSSVSNNILSVYVSSNGEYKNAFEESTIRN